MHWLLEPTVLHTIAAARRDPTPLMLAKAEDYERREEARDGPLPRGMSIAGNTAEVRVDGVLTKKPDLFAMFFGGGNTTYSSIRSALAVAETDPSIRDVVLHVDSPGGSVEGLYETLDAITNFRANSSKKLRVRADNAQSAAYAIAAAAGPIEAVTRASTFGSIGVAISYYLDQSVVTLTNSESPDKRPDLTTDEGKAVVVKHLDQLHQEFVSAIAKGRGITAQEVIEGYGRGASMTAAEAKRLGLIDRIAITAPRAVPNKQGRTAMSDETATDRAAIDAAVERGVTRERDRVLAHLQMGEASGDLSIAVEAIRSGAGMTQELNARYWSAGMNRADRQRRQVESNATETALAGTEASNPNQAPDLGDQVVALLKGENRSHIRG
jgi:capsid assembly protease